MFRVTIPTPCHEDWNKMNEVTQGRHCNLCSKTVVDFTSMTDEEVKNYLIKKKDENPCGRFKASQLYRIRIELPENILQTAMPWWKRFLVASLIVFSSTLFSCEVKTGKAKIDEGDKMDMMITSGVVVQSDNVTVGGLSYSSDTIPALNINFDVPVFVPPDNLYWAPEDSIDSYFIGLSIYEPDSTIDEPEVVEEEIQVIDTTADNCDIPPV